MGKTKNTKFSGTLEGTATLKKKNNLSASHAQKTDRNA